MLRRFLFGFVVFLSFAPALFAGVWYLNQPDTGDGSELRTASLVLEYSFVITFLSIYALFILLSIFILIQLCSYVVRAAASVWQKDTFSAWAFAAAVGISSVMITGVLPALYRIFSAIFFYGPPQALSRFANIFNDGAQCISSGPTMDPTACLTPLFNTTVLSISSLLGSVFQESGVAYLDLASIAMFVAISSIVYLSITRFLPNSEPATRVWLLFSAITIVALYLALTAILAVPLMQAKRNITEISPDNLRARLESFYTGAAFDQPVPPIVVAEAVQTQSPDRDVQYLEGMLATLREEISRNKDRLSDLSSGFKEFRTGLINNAVAIYETESAVRIGEREKSEHYLAILTWYRTQVDAQLSNIQKCRDQSEELNQIYNKMSIQLKRLESVSAQEAGAFNDRESIIKDMLETRGGALQDSFGCFSAVGDSGFFSPPVRGAYGSSLGSIGMATRWLLGTESLSVVLVVGLSGFGLLGALVSRFARRNESNRQDTTLDIISVAFSGFVAAFVVFLAAYGGIAIVSTSDSDPNPYVVFAACLVGAIFAEDVWAKARETFLAAADSRTESAGHQESQEDESEPPKVKPPKAEPPKAEPPKAEPPKAEPPEQH